MLINSVSTKQNIILFLKTFFNLHQANTCMFWHSKIAKNHTDKDHAREEPKCSMQAKPDDKLREELGENCLEDCGGKEDNGCSSTSYFSGKNFTYYQLQEIYI